MLEPPSANQNTAVEASGIVENAVSELPGPAVPERIAKCPFTSKVASNLSKVHLWVILWPKAWHGVLETEIIHYFIYPQPSSQVVWMKPCVGEG